MNKKPRLKQKISPKRSVRSNVQSNYENIICWQFSLMDMDGDFSCAKITSDDWLIILERMREWETMTWSSISGHRDHAISIETLSTEAQKRLMQINMDDIDEVFSLHIDGKKRLIGIRDRNIFRVLWWDKEHKVCPSHKKHT